MKHLAVKLPLVVLVALALSACGGRVARLMPGGAALEEKERPDETPRENTPQNRAIQVAWTSAGASHCGFNVPRDKLKADYLGYERAQGADSATVQKLEQTYDVTFRTFFSNAREQPNSCNKTRVELIRPDINRHLRGDYTPSARSGAPSS